jgi:predicted tellurium resistance membrane protein TerC
VVLLGEGLDLHVPKGYVYFAMAFAFAVEIINIQMRKKAAPVKLHKHVPGSPEEQG